MDLDRTEWEGGCHCGSVRFHVRLTNGLHTALRCNCSMCRMRGAVVVFAPLEGLTILSGEDKLGHYQFNTGTAHHYFCSNSARTAAFIRITSVVSIPANMPSTSLVSTD